MSPLLRVESSLTDRYQTTIPALVRKSLKITKRDKIAYTLSEDGTVSLSRVDENDPDLEGFLSFITTDIKNSPVRIKAVPHSLLKRAKKLLLGMKLDLEKPLKVEEGDDAKARLSRRSLR